MHQQLGTVFPIMMQLLAEYNHRYAEFQTELVPDLMEAYYELKCEPVEEE